MEERFISKKGGLRRRMNFDALAKSEGDFCRQMLEIPA